jgi:hypothetical protein
LIGDAVGFPRRTREAARVSGGFGSSPPAAL